MLLCCCKHTYIAVWLQDKIKIIQDKEVSFTHSLSLIIHVAEVTIPFSFSTISIAVIASFVAQASNSAKSVSSKIQTHRTEN